MQSANQQPNLENYPAFIWKRERNKLYLLLGIGICIIQFELFKVFYPFPDFFNDSFWYIDAAAKHLNISVWPIGYSKFLSFFPFLTRSGFGITAFQYFFMQLAALHFFFTITYFFNPSRLVQNILYLFFLLNPITLYICNTVASDALFGALTLLWLTELIWIIKKPFLYQLFIQAVLLFCCFTIRHTAYYYPLIAAIAIGFSSQKIVFKIVGILLPVFFLIPFILYTEEEAYKKIGIREFSFLTGWQLANNALYTYDYIKPDSTEFADNDIKQINNIASGFFKKYDSATLHRSINTYESDFFIIVNKSPLKDYFKIRRGSLKGLRDIYVWGIVSASFAPFGKSIILHHPLAYVQHFVVPNIHNYLLPPLADIKVYNYGITHIDGPIMNWFQYFYPKVYCASPHFQKFLAAYKWFFLLLNIYWVVLLGSILFKSRRIHLLKREYAFYYLLAGYLLVNFVFTIFLVVNILRYQYIPMYVLMTFGLLMGERLIYWKNARMPHYQG